jgi:ficolin
MARQNGQKFYAHNKDFDLHRRHCAQLFKRRWWYEMCHNSNLNGLYLEGNHKSFADGVNWRQLNGYYYSMKMTTMMARRE